MDDHGPLTTKALEYQDTTKRLAPTAREPEDWAPLLEFVAVEEFQRVGTFLEVQNWDEYAEMLTRWGTGIDRFDTTVRRVDELASRVYFEVEERHHRGSKVNVVNSLSIFEFNEESKICRLDVYLQQAR